MFILELGVGNDRKLTGVRFSDFRLRNQTVSFGIDGKVTVGRDERIYLNEYKEVSRIR